MRHHITTLGLLTTLACSRPASDLSDIGIGLPPSAHALRRERTSWTKSEDWALFEMAASDLPSWERALFCTLGSRATEPLTRGSAPSWFKIDGLREYRRCDGALHTSMGYTDEASIFVDVHDPMNLTVYVDIVE